MLFRKRAEQSWRMRWGSILACASVQAQTTSLLEVRSSGDSNGAELAAPPLTLHLPKKMQEHRDRNIVDELLNNDALCAIREELLGVVPEFEHVGRAAEIRGRVSDRT